MYCKKCGAELKEGQKFCVKCGNEVTPIVQPEEQQNVIEKWLTEFKDSGHVALKIFIFIQLFMLIISSYMVLYRIDGDFNMRTCSLWMIHIPFVITSWISIIKALRNIGDYVFWQKIRNALILRVIPILSIGLIVRIFDIYIFEGGIIYKEIPLFIAICGQGMAIVANEICSNFYSKSYAENAKAKDFLNVISVLAAGLMVMSAIASYLRLDEYDLMMIHLPILLKGKFSQMGFWGVVSLILGMIILFRTTSDSNANNVTISVVCGVVLVINIIVNSNKLIKTAIQEGADYAARGSAYYLMVIAPIVCALVFVIKALYYRRYRIKQFMKRYEEMG